MDGEWSDGAMSGGEQKGRREGVSADSSPGSPPAVPSTATSSAPSVPGRRRSLQKRVVTVPLADVNVPRPKGVGEGNTPTDSWAWRKYGQKPIKGSPFPRAYYRCSSSKGCPARKQVERNQADPDMVLVTYSYEHNHSSAVARTTQNRSPQKPNNKEQPSPPPPDQSADQPDHTHQAGAVSNMAGVQLVTESRPAPAAIEVHDEFRWLYDVVSVTSSTSASQVEEADDMLMYGPMFFGKAAVGTSSLLPDEFGDVVLGGEGTTSEEDAMFAGLGELPECAMVFRRHAGDGLAGSVKVEQPTEGTAMT